jgi:T-complex protein 1 subunit zeta
MSAASILNPNNELARKLHALLFNITAAKGLQGIVSSNLGPRGTLKMLVSAGGDIKITKDGQILLKEVHIQHPTASLIARSAYAQDEITGDGTTSIVLLIGELLSRSERLLTDGLHPSVLSQGIREAMQHLLKWVPTVAVKQSVEDHDFLETVAQTALRTKLARPLADKLATIVVDAVKTVQRPGQVIDLHMVETNLHMLHKSEHDTALIKGIVMDHGGRHASMPKRVNNAFLLTCNVSFEYEKTEENGTGMWTTPEEREKMVEMERKFTDDKVRKVIDLKRTVCKNGESFVIINQKGIDPLSLDMLAKEGILALRRAKRRNMERLTLACGGTPVNAVDDLTPDILGHADSVYEVTLGEEKYTFVEGVKNPFSCTILFRGPHLHGIQQIKDAVRDGLRAVKNAIEDGTVLPGAGAFELAAHHELLRYKDATTFASPGVKLGVEAFAQALLVIPRTLANNSGFDAIQTLLTLQDEHKAGHIVGLDLETGDPIDPAAEGIWDNYKVKTHLLESAALTAAQLLLVDEILKAGKAGASGN